MNIVLLENTQNEQIVRLQLHNVVISLRTGITPN